MTKRNSLRTYYGTGLQIASQAMESCQGDRIRCSVVHFIKSSLITANRKRDKFIEHLICSAKKKENDSNRKEVNF